MSKEKVVKEKLAEAIEVIEAIEATKAIEAQAAIAKVPTFEEFTMQIKNERPPNYDEIVAVFSQIVFDVQHPIFTYGDCIYNPYGIFISDDLIVHEKVHGWRQTTAFTPKSWWELYLTDAKFRTQEEVLSYSAQFDALCVKSRDRNAQIRILWNLASMLASPLYGAMLTISRSMQLIKEGSNEHNLH